MTQSQTDSHALAACVRELDALLMARIDFAADESASRRAMSVMERFHVLTATCNDAALVAAGCRLCADLADKLAQRLMDAHLADDAAIETLASALRRQLQSRSQRHRLLGRLQRVRQATQVQGEASGLGVIA
ncbi:MAG: hypothetical protein IPK79_03185 [Vampirovibrionales bacterium]|nr:hypothetical protein [Vampirovibrionales bacterium]